MSVHIIGIFDPNSPLIMGAAISTTSTITILAAAATNGQANDAPLFTLRNYYDADAGAGVTSTAWDLSLLHDMTAGGAAPASSGIFKIGPTGGEVTVLTLTNTNGTPSATFAGTLINLPNNARLLGAGTTQIDGTSIRFRDTNGNNGMVWTPGGPTLTFPSVTMISPANDADGYYLMLGARDSDTDAIVEVARVVGATVPYLSIGTSQQFKLYNDGTANLGGTISISNPTEGYTGSMNIKTVRQVVTLSGAQTSTTINIPAGAMLLGASFNVDTAVVTSAATNTWDADFTGGSTTNLVAASTAGAQNTKANKLIVPEIASAQTNIEFDAPGAETFSSGAIEVVAYYIDQTSLANA